MKTLFILVLLFPLTSFTQTSNDYGRSYSDTIPEKYILDIAKLREHIYANVPDNFKKDQYKVMTYWFADENAYRISNLLSSGQVYSDWQSLENYLNEILRKVIPTELRNDTVIRVYILQNGSYNAFMTPSGHFFMNIGFLAEIPNEATIASVFSHELAHYYLKHSLYTFIQAETGGFDMGFLFDSNKPFYQYSQKNEIEADSLAIRWLLKSGYNLNGFISSHEIMSRIEKNAIKKLRDEWELKATTHPLTGERLNRVAKFYDKNKNDSAKYFLVSERNFYEFKEASKPEILKIHLNNFQYYSCIEKAFRFHIFDPNNSVYIYYLMESIRRNCYLDVDLWNKMFITNRYYDTINVDGMHHKEKMKDNLFKKFDLEILPIDPADGMKIKTKYYWRDAPKFTTYEETFNFFYKVSQALNNHECILSNALSITHDKDSRNKLLNKYLSFDDIQYRKYAESLRSDSLTKNLSKNKLLALHDFTIRIRQGKNDINIPVPEYDKAKPLIKVFDSIAAEYKNRIPLFIPSIKNHKCNDYRMLTSLEEFSFFPTISKVVAGEKTELQILDPKYWEVFQKYNVNEIEFINCIYFESHVRAKILDVYKRTADLDYESFFSKTKSTKYLYTYISSVREMEGKAMKTRYYGGGDKIKSKETTANQIISLVKYRLKAKEQRTGEVDYWNMHK